MFRIRNSNTAFILAMVLGAILAVGGSVWATSVGTNISVTGNLTVSSTSASSTVTYALGVGTSTPSVKFAVGGAGGTSTGHGYFTGGLGVGAISTTAGQVIANVSLGIATTTPAQELSVVGDVYLTSGLGIGIATTTAGGLETTGAGLVGGAFNVTGITQFNGNVIVGDAAGDTLTVTSNSITYSNVATSTIATNANAFAYATSSASIPFVKFDASNTRVGISTTTPGATLAVGGNGTAIVMGDATSSISIQSTLASRGGCIELETTDGANVVSLMATSSGNVVYWVAGGCR